MKRNLVMPAVAALALAGGSALASCSNNGDNGALLLKQEQIGVCLGSFCDAYARHPEAGGQLDEAKKELFDAFEEVESEGKYYALGNLAGANGESRYLGIKTSGLFDSIARQPEAFDDILGIEKDAIVKIKGLENDFYAEMIGLGTGALFDAVARQPECASMLTAYASLIDNSITQVKQQENAASIGYSSVGFYDAVARNPESASDLWLSYKGYIDTLL